MRTQASQSAERRVRQSAALLNERMEAIAAATKELSSLRVAVMAGLDIATELLAEREGRRHDEADDEAFRKSVRQRSQRLLELVEEELVERTSVTGFSRGSQES